MSYGWLTESSIMPKKGKEIKVDETSLVDLKATIMALKDKKTEEKKKQVNIKRNANISKRIEKDLREQKNIAEKVKDSYQSLVNKQKVYDYLEKQEKNHKSLLVDFSSKSIPEEDQQYQALKQKFYREKLTDIQKQRASVHQQLIVGSTQKDLRQRLNWQKQVLDQLKGTIENKQMVSQSFHKKFTQHQKKALQKVLTQQEFERQRIDQIKSKRQGDQQDRIRKLKKLNILND